MRRIRVKSKAAHTLTESMALLFCFQVALRPFYTAGGWGTVSLRSAVGSNGGADTAGVQSSGGVQEEEAAAAAARSGSGQQLPPALQRPATVACAAVLRLRHVAGKGTHVAATPLTAVAAPLRCAG